MLLLLLSSSFFASPKTRASERAVSEPDGRGEEGGGEEVWNPIGGRE